MDLDNIKEFIQLAKEEGVTELKYEKKDLKLSVSFSSSQIQIPVQAQQIPLSADSLASAVPRVKDDFHVVTSPFVGTFYAQSAPGTPAYAKVGDNVSKGQTLCVLEAMKIMNEIEADVSGEIVEVCVENENLVEFGQPLFKIRV